MTGSSAPLTFSVCWKLSHVGCCFCCCCVSLNGLPGLIVSLDFVSFVTGQFILVFTALNLKALYTSSKQYLLLTLCENEIIAASKFYDVD